MIKEFLSDVCFVVEKTEILKPLINKGHILFIQRFDLCSQIQFVVLMFQQVYAMFLPTCEYPLWLLTFFLSQALLMIYLFSDFYYKAYIKKQETKKS